jgi:hypothetical protein
VSREKITAIIIRKKDMAIKAENALLIPKPSSLLESPVNNIARTPDKATGIRKALEKNSMVTLNIIKRRM